MSTREEEYPIKNLIKITTKGMEENMSITGRILKRDIRIRQILGNRKEEVEEEQLQEKSLNLKVEHLESKVMMLKVK